MALSSSSAAIVYEDFEPQVVFSQEKDGSAILYEVHLPDFSREEIKVIVTVQRRVKAQGERHSPVKGAENKWMRFCVERPIPQGYDQDKISAMFKSDILTIKIPKIRTIDYVNDDDDDTDYDDDDDHKPNNVKEYEEGKDNQLKNDAKSENGDLKNDAKSEIGDLKNDAKSSEEEQNGAKNGVPIAKQVEMKMRKFGKMVLNTYNDNSKANLGSLFLVLGVSIGIALYVKNIYSTSSLYK
ncbi:unnamed protein product [Cuscuta campestris]|uniref:SHSP domain-containing protein n=1 Tax=Cuscuta campestris TaxID=132261 RepID=A0A484L5C6_9ASTE|nr:unnamed protein product [Cuscuta campestris]